MSTTTPVLKIKKVLSNAKIPVRATPTASGLDLHASRFEKLYSANCADESAVSCTEESQIHLAPGQRVLVHTGISATVGSGWEIQIRPRSGLALKQGLTVLNTPGTIDEDYRGPICVILINHSEIPQTLKIDDRIAQMVVCPVSLCDCAVVDDLDVTVRGSGGFGSTGV